MSRRNYREKLVCDPSERRTKSDPTADINYIVRKYGVAGNHPAVRVPLPDGSAPKVDMLEAMNVIANAQNMFSLLPATVRYERFQNDFRNFYKATLDVKQVERLVEDGILTLSDEAVSRKAGAATAAAAKPASPAPSESSADDGADPAPSPGKPVKKK